MQQTEIIPAQLLASIHRLNRAYLHTARDLLRTGQPQIAAALFGLDAALARWLADAPPEAIERLATTPGTLFRPRLPADTGRLLARCTRAPARDITALHLLLRNLGDEDAGGAGDDELPKPRGTRR